MKDVLLQNYELITHSVEISAAVTGLILYNRYKPTAAKFFIWFLVYLSFGDFAGNYVHYIKNEGVFNFLEGTPLTGNFWWTTLYWEIGAVLFVAFYYHKILSNIVFKIIIKISGFIFFIFSIIYILTHFQAYFKMFFPPISIFGAAIVFMCVIFYFIEVLLNDKILNFYKSLNFYISFAFFIWWIIITPIVFFDIYNGSKDQLYIDVQRLIFLTANVAMYLTFTFALIWCRPEKKTEVSLV
ncbi:hypothetical protein RBH94_12895 [Aestuariibaculum sp. YM273]|uniref:hypothetical protein n=1 Tax=Aestuariibaculum sp. YM273 TaxID=3070659 RepID=UPI0027DB6AB2|nr:hypothetical protein [Aestuariibaculum sp. YM273]WMI64953.1 hypothetical protein RBH94_12895 [Aestuariibaculum sp. YM273]